ncbi:MAG: hypothetical protein ACE5IJ_05615 [Thermoplasmata archaeon]
MTIVELNGFDESGIIGENLRFTRNGLDVHQELRPYIYNLLHFGSVVVTKAKLKGESPRYKKAYVRAIMDDPAIQIDTYAYPPSHQLNLLRFFSVSEFATVGTSRRELIQVFDKFDEPSSKEKLSEIIERLKVYIKPHRLVETFIKSYGYRMVIEDLKVRSKVLRDSSIVDYRVVSLVDGGFPFVFWSDSFLREREMMGERFSTRNTPIFGITHGDGYYPLPAMAGHISTILNWYPEMIYPQNVKELPTPTEDIFREFYGEFKRTCNRPRFLSRVLFIGEIDATLQFLIPFIQCKIDNNRIYEPFRIGESFRSFYKEYRGDSQNDLVIQGILRRGVPEEEKFKQCSDYGLKVRRQRTMLTSLRSSFKTFLMKQRTPICRRRRYRGSTRS